MSKRGKRFQAGVGSFFKQYQRKAHSGHDPNDRSYDIDVERKIKAMDPELLSQLMNDDLDTDIPSEIEDRWYSGKSMLGISFNLNDFVGVKTGKHEGKTGDVIALLRMNPEPEYVVEVGGGKDQNIKAFQSNLTLLPRLDNEEPSK